MINNHPNFFLVGVVKGGTTSLHHYLDQHPEIYMSPVKETNFFSRNDINPTIFSKAYAHDVNVDLKKYLSKKKKEKIHIAHVTQQSDYFRLFSKVDKETAIGEASNSYLLYPTAPKLIREAYPKAKIMVMLRNPVERAYSQYIMNIRLGKTLETDFIHEIQQDNQKEIRGWGANHQYLYIGKYHKQIKRYLDIFPREQVLICWYDEYRRQPEKVLNSICNFLEVRSDFVPNTNEKLNTAGVPKYGKLNYYINQNGLVSWAKRKFPRSWRKPFKKMMYSTEQSDIPKMTADEREWLINYYREDIMNLSGLLNRDLSDWLK